MECSIDVLLENLDENLLAPEIQELVDDIGLDTLIHLSKVRGGGSIYIPLLKTILAPVTINLAMKDFAEGMSIPHIAVKYEISQSSIRNAIKKLQY